MITALRKHVKSTASSVVIWIGVLGLMGVFSLPMLIKNMKNSGLWAIKVNKYEISRQAYARMVSDYQSYVSQLRSQYGEFADYLRLNIDPHTIALEFLVNNALIIQLAHSLGFTVDHEFVIQKLHDSQFVQRHLSDVVPSFLISDQGGINQEVLSLYLARRHMSVAEFEEGIVNAITRYIVLSLLQESVYLPSYDIAYTMRMKNASRAFSLLHFPLDMYIKKEDETIITPEEVESFYNKENTSTKRYWVAEKRSGTAWVFDPKQYNIDISSDAIDAYYQEHKATMYVESPAKIRVRKLVIDKSFSPIDGTTAYEFITQKRQYLLDNPDAFVDVVNEFSTKKDGTIDSLIKKNPHDPIERAAFALSEPGSISDVIETQDSYVVLQQIEKIAKTIKPLSTVRSEIKAKLLDTEFKELFAKEAQTLMLPQGGFNSAQLDSFVRDRGGVKELIQLTALNEKSSRVRTLFGLKSGDIGFSLEGKKGVVIKLDSIERAYLPEWNSISDQIIQDIKIERARDALSKDVQKVVHLLKEGVPSEIADTYGVTIEYESLSTGKTHKKGSVFEKMGIAEQDVNRLEKVGSVHINIGEESIDLIRLDSLDIGSFDPSSDVNKEEAKTINATNQQRAIQGLVASLYRTAKIETNEIVSNSTEDILYE